MASTTRSCPVCAGTEFNEFKTGVLDFEYGSPGTYQWIRCRQCSMIALTPLPSDATLSAAYPPDYHAYVQPKAFITRLLIQHSRKKLVAQLSALVKENQSVLDIGCSTGQLLLGMGRTKTLQLNGVEYNPEAASQARSHGIRVWTGSFEEADIPPASMDLIIMQHVLEHVRDPKAVLEKAFSLLRPNGLVAGELPNIASWDASIFGRYWGGGHAPRHLYHFTPQTLGDTLARAGFRDVSISPSLHTGHWALSFQNFFRRSATSLKGLKSGRTWYYPLFLLLTIPVNVIQYPLLKTGVMRFKARRTSS
jgi:SAM-dependent methyltransferase